MDGRGKLIPVLKQATSIRKNSGILGKIAITLSPGLMATTEDNAFAALKQRQRKPNIIMTFFKGGSRGVFPVSFHPGWGKNISCDSSQLVLSYKLSLHYYCSVHVTEECVELAKNYFCLLLDIKRSNSLAICAFTGLLKVHHDLSSIIWIYFLFFSFGDILQYRVCSLGTLIIKATKSSTWTVGFFFRP